MSDLEDLRARARRAVNLTPTSPPIGRAARRRRALQDVATAIKVTIVIVALVGVAAFVSWCRGDR